MDQVINALNELHQKATNAIEAFQRGSSHGHPWKPQQQQLHSCPAVAGSSSSSRRRVHFAPPFAALSPLGLGGGGKAGDSSIKKQKEKQDDDDERILISEVGTAVGCSSL